MPCPSFWPRQEWMVMASFIERMSSREENYLPVWSSDITTPNFNCVRNNQVNISSSKLYIYNERTEIYLEVDIINFKDTNWNHERK